MGVERTPNKSQNTKLTQEKNILPPLLPGFELATFRLRVRRSDQQAIPASREGGGDNLMYFCLYSTAFSATKYGPWKFPVFIFIMIIINTATTSAATTTSNTTTTIIIMISWLKLCPDTDADARVTSRYRKNVCRATSQKNTSEAK